MKTVIFAILFTAAVFATAGEVSQQAAAMNTVVRTTGRIDYPDNGTGLWDINDSGEFAGGWQATQRTVYGLRSGLNNDHP